MNPPSNPAQSPCHYLVTGGAGFIGSHLVDALLQAGHRVTVVDDLSSGKRENVAGRVTLHVGSITDTDLIGRLMADVDGCFHLAAIASVPRSIDDWRGTNAVNLGGSITVFEAAARRPGASVPVVFASSAAVYGDVDRLPITEASRLQPLSAYGADKLATEFHAKAGGAVHGLRSFGVRPFNIYGPRQDPRSPYSGVISIFVARARRGEDLPLIDGGRQTRDFVFVDDCVRFLIAGMAMAATTAPVVNIASGQATLIAELAQRIIRLAGSRSQAVAVPPRRGDIAHSCGDPEYAATVLGTRATTSLEEGLRILLDGDDPAHTRATN